MVPEIPANVVVLGDTRDLHHHGCEAVMAELISGLSSVGLHRLNVLPGLNWRRNNDACLSADLVVINGEGSLHHSRPVIADILDLAEKRRALGRPTALVNTSWFHNTPAHTSRLAAFNIVSARDKLSASEIIAHGPEPRFVPDLAIVHALNQRATASEIRRGPAMVSDSTLPSMTRQLRRLARVRHWDYLPVLARPLTPRPGAKSLKIHRRCQIAEKLGPLAQWLLSPRYHAHMIGLPETQDYLTRLAACEGVVTGRFHTVCFAIGLQTPFVAVSSNTPKIESLINDVGLDSSLRMVTPESLTKLTQIPPYSPAEQHALTSFATHTLNSSGKLFTDLARLVAVH